MAKAKTFKFSVAMRRSLAIVSIATVPLLLVGCSTATAVLSGDVILDPGTIEREIESGVLNQSGIVVTAECPDPMTGKVGDVKQCVVEDESGTVAIVKVTIQNQEGFVVWEVQ